MVQGLVDLWIDGVMEWWSDGVMEWWSNGVVRVTRLQELQRCVVTRSHGCKVTDGEGLG